MPDATQPDATPRAASGIDAPVSWRNGLMAIAFLLGAGGGFGAWVVSRTEKSAEAVSARAERAVAEIEVRMKESLAREEQDRREEDRRLRMELERQSEVTVRKLDLIISRLPETRR